jgi:hypothetical protein
VDPGLHDRNPTAATVRAGDPVQRPGPAAAAHQSTATSWVDIAGTSQGVPPAPADLADYDITRRPPRADNDLGTLRRFFSG